MTFSGSIVALVTPFRNGAPDLEKIGSLVEFHRAAGTSAIGPCGTTGEGATLTAAERGAVIGACKRAAGPLPVIAGVGTNVTRDTVQNAKAAADAGADALLVVTPYYNKPNPAGMRAHFEAVADATPLPIILYNVPGRTGVNLEVETVVALARRPTIVAVKEASGDLEQVGRILAQTKLAVLSGDDALTWPILKMGGAGVISVAANIIPRPMAELCRAARDGRPEQARELHDRYQGLFKALFIESNPIPVKAAMRHMGLIDSDELRLPLARIDESNDAALRSVLKEHALI
jgi:4-hydroxy-tetrahydrodipicolinate synthase